MWLELMPATPPCRLLIALKAIIPATATTCSKSTIKSARESFMFGSERSSKSAPEAVARRVVAARNFFLRVRSSETLSLSFGQGVDETPELVAPVGVALEHVERGSARRKEDHVASFRGCMRAFDRIRKRARDF